MTNARMTYLVNKYSGKDTRANEVEYVLATVSKYTAALGLLALAIHLLS